MKRFFDSELWKWLLCLIEIAMLASVILLAVKGIDAFLREVGG